ncbi:MAG: hypothetical protein HY321_06655 [Armatimonadetes bacterium]|nr:hypothetical protein [Armatimonadota bacterium]
MPSRSNSRDFAIILFCLIGIGLLNDFSHNRYRGLTSPWPYLAKVLKLGTTVDLDIYRILSYYAENRQIVEKFGSVVAIGYILQEKPTDLQSGEVQKVGKTFRLARRLSETPTQENSHVISVPVTYKEDQGFEPGVWVRVQGKVVPDPASADPAKPQPMIQATSVTEVDKPPYGEVLLQEELPQLVDPDAPEESSGDEHDGHSH